MSNLRVVSSSAARRTIEVEFDYPNSCFDQLILICESLSSKSRRSFINATVCTDLFPDQSYRISVETSRIGWATISSDLLEMRLVATASSDMETSTSSCDSFVSFRSEFSFFSLSSLTQNNLVPRPSWFRVLLPFSYFSFSSLSPFFYLLINNVVGELFHPSTDSFQGFLASEI